MMKKFLLLLACLLLLLPAAISQASEDTCSCVSIVGDDDNFGRTTCCWDVTHEPDDGVFDAWNPDPKEWTHTVNIPSGSNVTSATLTIKSFNIQDGGTSYNVQLFIDGVEIPDAFDQVYAATDTITVFQLDSAIYPLMKDGEIMVRVSNPPSGPQDSFAIDYSKLEVHYPCTVPVTIDIKPGSDPSSFGANSNGKIPVAVFGSLTFDVSKIDDGTVLFGNTPFSGAAPLTVSLEDKNADGMMDKVYHFEFRQTNLTPGDTLGYLSGKIDGINFLGTGDVNIVGKSKVFVTP